MQSQCRSKPVQSELTWFWRDLAERTVIARTKPCKRRQTVTPLRLPAWRISCYFDGLHGQEVPPGDGTNGPVTQDGPGGPPSAVNLVPPHADGCYLQPCLARQHFIDSTTALKGEPATTPALCWCSLLTTITVVLASMTTLTVGGPGSPGTVGQPFNRRWYSVVSPLTTFVAAFYSSLSSFR